MIGLNSGRHRIARRRPRRMALMAVATTGLFAAFGTPGALAQEYPSRAVTIVSPFPPTSTPDVLSRWIAPKLQERLGQPFVVENRTGAGGIIGFNSVVKSAPNGYTIMMAAAGAMAVNVTLHKNLPYDPVADFVPLALMARGYHTLVVTPSLPVKSVQDLIKLAKEKPGTLSYASLGIGTPGHLFAEMLKKAAGIEITHVPYTTGPMNDVVAGHVPMMFPDFAPAGQLIRSGKLRALAVTSQRRLPAAPEVPTMIESGFPEFSVSGWLMVVAPSQIPRAVAEKLHREISTIINTEQLKGQIGSVGMVPAGDTPENASIEAMQAFVKSEIAGWGKLVREAGLAGSQ